MEFSGYVHRTISLLFCTSINVGFHPPLYQLCLVSIKVFGCSTRESRGIDGIDDHSVTVTSFSIVNINKLVRLMHSL